MGAGAERGQPDEDMLVSRGKGSEEVREPRKAFEWQSGSVISVF